MSPRRRRARRPATINAAQPPSELREIDRPAYAVYRLLPDDWQALLRWGTIYLTPLNVWVHNLLIGG